MKHLAVLSRYTVKGMRDSWFADETKGTEYYKEWNELLKMLDDGKPKKVVIYPMGESQILDNSEMYYTSAVVER